VSELVTCDREEVRSEPTLVRVEIEAGPSTRVVHPHDARLPSSVARSQLDHEAVPRRVVAPAGVLEAVDRGPAVDHQPTGHPEVEPERRAVAVAPGRVEQDELAVAPGRGEPQTRQGRRELAVAIGWIGSTSTRTIVRSSARSAWRR
jgi:hypothetical protein